MGTKTLTDPTRKNSKPGAAATKTGEGAATRAPEITATAAPGRQLTERSLADNAKKSPATERAAFFSLEAGSARKVLLAGAFTDWTAAPVSMEKDARGVWNASLKLPPGRHRYRFLVDGEWQDDPKCYQRVPNPYGTFDSIIEI